MPIGCPTAQGIPMEFVEVERIKTMSNLPISGENLPELARSEDLARRAVLQALRSRTPLTRPLFTHDCDDDPAILFSDAAPFEGGNDKPGLDDLIWEDHRGWEL